MGSIHKFTNRGGSFNWEKQKVVPYGEAEGAKGAVMKWILGPFERTPYFALRYIEIEPGGWSSLDQHEHDHGVFVIRGQGKVRHGDMETDLTYGDAVYIPPEEVHQFFNTGDEPFGFLCVIPRKQLLRRLKILGLTLTGEGET